MLKNAAPVYPDIKVKALAELYRIPVFDASEVYIGSITKISDFKANFIVAASFGRIPKEIYIDNSTTVINPSTDIDYGYSVGLLFQLPTVMLAASAGINLSTSATCFSICNIAISNVLSLIALICSSPNRLRNSTIKQWCKGSSSLKLL